MGGLKGYVSFRRLQDARQVAGQAAVHCAYGQRLRPHAIIGKAVDTYEGGARELVTQLSQFCKINHFEIDDRKFGPGARDGVAGVFLIVDSCDVEKLFLDGSDDFVSQRRVLAGKHNVDWRHGNTPS